MKVRKGQTFCDTFLSQCDTFKTDLHARKPLGCKGFRDFVTLLQKFSYIYFLQKKLKILYI